MGKGMLQIILACFVMLVETGDVAVDRMTCMLRSNFCIFVWWSEIVGVVYNRWDVVVIYHNPSD